MSNGHVRSEKSRQSRLEIAGCLSIVFPVPPRLKLFFTLLCACGPLSAGEPQRVLVLANRDDGESIAVARHYVEKRGLPETVIVALPMPLTEQITWPEFVAAIWNPLLREAVAREAIDAMPMRLTDEVGRTKIVPNGHRLDALVVCRGVPLRVEHAPAFLDEKSNPLASNAQFRTNEGAVDSELALLATNCPPIAAFISNPLYSATGPAATEAALREVIPVGRLDGPSVADAKSLVDRALVAERDGLAGRAYVDIGGPHRQGDEWLEACVPELTALGFETDVDRDGSTLPAHARFDAPALYFGWYAGAVNGPFNSPGLKFPPGAVALHIHSFSASTVRSSGQAWVGPLVARGATAVLGNVGEPYLQFTHQPHLLLRALARGDTLGVAALRSINALSWKGVVVGDPLYRPFAVSADAQWENRGVLAPEAETYARVRRMRLLSAAGRGEDALELGLDGMRTNPTLPLALTLAGMQLSAGDPGAARATLGVFAALPFWRVADHALVMSAARALQAAGAPVEGVGLFERLLADKKLDTAFRLAALRQGADLAKVALDFTRAGRWDAEHARLTAPPPETKPGALEKKPAKK